jgi:hypothetical protein
MLVRTGCATAARATHSEEHSCNYLQCFKPGYCRLCIIVITVAVLTTRFSPSTVEVDAYFEHDARRVYAPEWSCNPTLTSETTAGWVREHCVRCFGSSRERGPSQNSSHCTNAADEREGELRIEHNAARLLTYLSFFVLVVCLHQRVV